MKISLLGATERTGKHIVERHKKRHEISAIAGCEVVINTLIVSRKSDSPWAPMAAPRDMISKSASNAVKAMEKAGTKRFVA